MLVLQCVTAGLLLLLALLLLGIRGRLRRIERWLAGQTGRNQDQDAAVRSPADEHAPGGAFEQFLDEDPSRRELPKAEQFTEYRRWRNDRGLNWTKS